MFRILDKETLIHFYNIILARNSNGKKIQNYHRIAGRWLTKELKTKTSEIKVISESDSQTGVINGIGEVQIYTVEDILEKTFVTRSVINHVEELY